MKDLAEIPQKGRIVKADLPGHGVVIAVKKRGKP